MADVRRLDTLLGDHPFLAGLDTSALELIAACAVNVHSRPGEYLFREGEPADRFYLVRRGQVTLEVHQPAGGGHIVDSIHDGEVLGWSWLLPPYRTLFDARAVGHVSAVSIDGACLRGKCDDDDALGYALMRRVAQVVHRRLQATQVRLLDLYGRPGAGLR